jgi:hypothetical protein
MKCTSITLTGRKHCELFYMEGLLPLFDQQLPPLDTLYAFPVIRDVSWKLEHPERWETQVYQIVPMEPLTVDEEDIEYQWLLDLRSTAEQVKLHAVIQTDSTNPEMYTYFIASLRLTFPVQGSSEMAACCIQQLEEVFKRHDIPLETVNCTVEGWREDTTFHALTEHDIRKLRWNAAHDRFMHSEEESV